MKRTTSVLKNALLIFGAIFIVVFLSFSLSQFSAHTHTEEGICDMSSFSFDEKSRYPLFDDFVRTSYNDENKISVYECTILLPDDVTSIGMRIPPIDAPFSLSINNSLISQRTDSNKSYLATAKVATYHLQPEDDHKLHIVIQASDIYKNLITPTHNPIAYRDFLIGSVSAVCFFENLFILFDVVLVSICVISAAFHFIAYLYKNDTRNHLFFSLLSLSGILCILITNQRCIIFSVPNISLEIGYKILIIGYFLRIFSLIELCKIAFQNLHHKTTFAFLGLSNYAISMLCLILPAPHIYYTQHYYALATCLFIILAINEGIHSYQYDHTSFTKVLILGYSIMFIGSISDITHVFGFSKAYSTFYVSQIIFILLQSIITSIEYNESLKTNQRLTINLKQKVFDIQNNKSSYIYTHIDPKYIYSALSLVEKNIDVDQDKVDRLVQSLSKYLRHTFDYSSDVSIYSYKKELELCHAMAEIITTKSPHIKIEFNVDENIPNVQIPMFSLASLIDNALTYSMKGIIRPTIIISIKNIGKYIEFSVYDNGIGISRNEISYILEHPHIVLSYGIYHINQMLIDKCNTKLNITSKVNRYTIVSFLIPLENMEEE